MMWVRFGDYDTLADFGLFCSGYEVSAPETQRYTVDVPGRDGALDMTDELFDGILHYNNREITIELDAILAPSAQPWPEIQSSVYDAIHGQTLDIAFADDPDFYWTGACSVSGSAADGTIEIIVDAEPYKKEIRTTKVTVNGSQTLLLKNSRMPAIPAITATDDAEITSGTTTVTLSAGEYDEVAELQLTSGGNTWEIETDGAVTITYRQGRL